MTCPRRGFPETAAWLRAALPSPAPPSTLARVSYVRFRAAAVPDSDHLRAGLPDRGGARPPPAATGRPRHRPAVRRPLADHRAPVARRRARGRARPLPGGAGRLLADGSSLPDDPAPG